MFRLTIVFKYLPILLISTLFNNSTILIYFCNLSLFYFKHEYYRTKVNILKVYKYIQLFKL